MCLNVGKTYREFNSGDNHEKYINNIHTKCKSFNKVVKWCILSDILKLTLVTDLVPILYNFSFQLT